MSSNSNMFTYLFFKTKIFIKTYKYHFNTEIIFCYRDYKEDLIDLKIK